MCTTPPEWSESACQSVPARLAYHIKRSPVCGQLRDVAVISHGWVVPQVHSHLMGRTSHRSQVGNRGRGSKGLAYRRSIVNRW